MAYRGDTDPLKTRETALASELSSIRRRERDVVRALDDTRSEIRRQRTVALPLLEDVRIASPCSASWEDMTGDARVRFCGKCEKNVYNLSEMTREEGEKLLANSEGKMCVRLYKRHDGTVITTDCPVGVRKKRVRRVVAVAAATFGAGAMASLAACSMMGARATMGDVAPVTPVTMGKPVAPTQATATANLSSTPPDPTVQVMQGAPPVRTRHPGPE